MITNPQFFFGVVEDIHDPSRLNRVRVRIFSKHTEDKTLMPTKSLPWCNVVMPVTCASTSGVGQTIGLVQGSWVFGTFVDGANEQDALILGSMPGESTQQTQDGEGFKDPSGVYPKQTGADTPNSATDSGSDVYKNRLAQRVTDIPIATRPQLSSLSDDEKPEDKSVSVPDPQTYYQPQYPHNNVTQTESGHIIEYDDTPGYERISTTHRSGTSSDIISDGSKIETIVGNGYTVHSKDNTVYIVGNCNLTVDRDVNVKCGGDYVLDVEGDMVTNVLGNTITKIGGDAITELVGKRELNIGTTDLLKVKDGQVIDIGDDQQLTIGVNQVTQVGATRTQVILADDILNVGGQRNSTVTGNDFDICLSQKLVSSTNNMKINCTEKITINTPLQQVSGDVRAGSGDVSLITHVHRQKNGKRDAGGGIDTVPSTGGTAPGS